MKKKRWEDKRRSGSRLDCKLELEESYKPLIGQAEKLEPEELRNRRKEEKNSATVVYS